jgi:hypothetical protein
VLRRSPLSKLANYVTLRFHWAREEAANTPPTWSAAQSWRARTRGCQTPVVIASDPGACPARISGLARARLSAASRPTRPNPVRHLPASRHFPCCTPLRIGTSLGDRG